MRSRLYRFRSGVVRLVLKPVSSTDSSELWDILKTLLSNPREQRLAYLLFQCGLKPGEIVHFCSQEFSSIREVYSLRRNIMERLLRNADLLRWRLS